MNSSNQRTIRRHTKDRSFSSSFSIGDVSLSSCSTSLGPNIYKDLPRIPSTSTGLWDTDPMTVLSEVMASPATSPMPNRLPLPAPQNLRKIATTVTQDIAAGYRRHGSLEALRIEVPCPPILEVPGERTSLVPGTHEEPPLTDVDLEVSSFVLVTPTIRRLFVWELDTAPTPYAARRMLNKVDQDGPLPCTHYGCDNVLPTHKAYNCHLDIHTIHDRLKFCELCGTLFTDGEYKDEHLNSCPKMPTFHDIESFDTEPPVSPLQSFLGRFRS